ncbi:TSSK6 kinase, partial [Penelope pileata]|nr:TSSK6 kinase [Penelope pileata]
AEEKVLRKLGFVLGRTLGVGGFSKVKAATSTKYKVPLAIKVIDQRWAPSNFMEKFLPRELSILHKLDHPNIMRTLEIIGLSNGMVYIVMEALATDLEQQLLTQGKLPCVPNARDIFVQIVGGVHYLHDCNLVHRDLKCENILLSADSCHARITDFGLGKEISSDLDPSNICGTVSYARPEMQFGIPHNTKKSDIWSLGVVLFAMVTGYLPFGSCLCNMIQEQKKGVLHLKAVSLLPEPCQALIAQLLQFGPASRPSMEQVASNGWLKG